jgi:hypothetical protein
VAEIHWTTRRHIRQDNILHSRHSENIASLITLHVELHLNLYESNQFNKPFIYQWNETWCTSSDQIVGIQHNVCFNELSDQENIDNQQKKLHSHGVYRCNKTLKVKIMFSVIFSSFWFLFFVGFPFSYSVPVRSHLSSCFYFLGVGWDWLHLVRRLLTGLLY